MQLDLIRRLDGKDLSEPLPGPHILAAASLFPRYQIDSAFFRGVEKNILLSTWGGIGDQICSEPTLRWATRGGLPNCKITLACDYPEMFSHLNFDDVYNLSREKPIMDDHFHFHVAVSQNSLFDQFISHMLTPCVDYPTLAAFHRTLYISEKNIVLEPDAPRPQVCDLIGCDEFGAAKWDKFVAVHPGKHWESKTFPVEWWNQVLVSIKAQGLIPVLIGAKDNKHGGGYVEVDRSGCVDLLDKTTIMESVWLLQHIGVLVCSDSSPLHMAASGTAFIGFLATAKHPDYVTHHRRNLHGVNEWSWRMRNFSLGGIWDLMDSVPTLQPKLVDKVDPDVLKSWLPDPNVFGPWCKESLDEYIRTV